MPKTAAGSCQRLCVTRCCCATERLSALTREVLRAAAIAGRSVDHRLLAHLVGLDELTLLDALREATDNHVLVPGAGGMTYAFRHALLREAIYDDALPAERLRLHRSIAETLGRIANTRGPPRRLSLPTIGTRPARGAPR